MKKSNGGNDNIYRAARLEGGDDGVKLNQDSISWDQLERFVPRNPLLRWALGGLFLLTLTTMAGWPQMVDLYHLQAGARALHNALGEIDQLTWWYLGPRTVYDARSLEQSIAHLSLVRFQPYAWRLLGQAYAAQGDILHSIEALERFVGTRPQHPLARLELAAAYMLAQEQWQAMYRIDLLDHLAEATLAAPDLPGNVHYDAKDWPSQYVYPTHFVLPADGQERPTLFLHAGAQVTFTLALTQPLVLRFGMALDPRSLGWGGDGATFEVFVNGQQVFLEHLTVEMARMGWHEREVNLSDWTGQVISLTLATTPGLYADITADWAGWGTPRVEDIRAGQLAALRPAERMVQHWHAGGVNAEMFVTRGEVARKAQRYEEALRWYGQASTFGVDVESTRWFVLFQIDENWEALQKSVLVDHGWVDKEMRLRAWLRWGLYLLEHQRETEAETVLQQVIATCPESAAFLPLLSEMYRILGLSQWAQGKIDEAASSLKRAVELNARNTWAHIHYGKVIFGLDRNLATQTEREFDIALEQDSRVDIWKNLIRFWFLAEEPERAHRLCERARIYGLSQELANECPQE